MCKLHWGILLFPFLCCLVVCCDQAEQPGKAIAKTSNLAEVKPVVNSTSVVAERASPASPPVVSLARAQVGKTILYDPSYVRLDYPGGDVQIDRGVCTDVVVRALRDAFGMDLQKLVHEDMKVAFASYPKIWGLSKPDRNIDHRRVPNLQQYFERKGYSLAVTKSKNDYLPGDLVTCTVPSNRPHIMIVSDKITSEGIPLVIHNIGRGTQEEDRLFEFPLTGHYRIDPANSNNRIDQG